MAFFNVFGREKGIPFLAIAGAVVDSSVSGTLGICKALQQTEVISETEFGEKTSALFKELGAFCLSNCIAVTAGLET